MPPPTMRTCWSFQLLMPRLLGGIVEGRPLPTSVRAHGATGQGRSERALLRRLIVARRAHGMAAGMIDVHFHLIPQFYRDAVYEAGSGPAIGRYPDWTPAAGARSHGQARHRACACCRSASPASDSCRRTRPRLFAPPLQRLRRRADRAAPEALRLLRAAADARHRRGDRGSPLLPRNAALRRHFAVRKLRREISRRRRVRSAAALSRRPQRGRPRPSEPASVEQVARSAVAGFHDRISVRHHARGGQSVVLRRARALCEYSTSSCRTPAAPCPTSPGGFRWRR